MIKSFNNIKNILELKIAARLLERFFVASQVYGLLSERPCEFTQNDGMDFFKEIKSPGWVALDLLT